MTDRALLFLVSLAALLGAVAAAIWLILTGQVGTFDGNFLLLSSLVVALPFGLYLRYMIKTASTPEPSKPSAAPAEKKSAPAPELVGKI